MGINLIITITQRRNTEEFVEFFKKYGCTAILTAVANGTASKNILSVLGIESTEKAVSFTFAGDRLTSRIMKKLSSEMKIDTPYRGMAVSVPFSSVGSHTAAYLVQETEDESASDKEVNSVESKYELIIAICAGGHTDDVMDAARSAGAAGGTVVHAKGTGAAEAKKFFGLSIADEKEMVFIVSSIAKKSAIMRSVMQNAGAGTPAGALVFSLPVRETAGFKLIDAEDDE